MANGRLKEPTMGLVRCMMDVSHGLVLGEQIGEKFFLGVTV